MTTMRKQQQQKKKALWRSLAVKMCEGQQLLGVLKLEDWARQAIEGKRWLLAWQEEMISAG